MHSLKQSISVSLTISLKFSCISLAKFQNYDQFLLSQSTSSGCIYPAKSCKLTAITQSFAAFSFCYQDYELISMASVLLGFLALLITFLSFLIFLSFLMIYCLFLASLFGNTSISIFNSVRSVCIYISFGELFITALTTPPSSFLSLSSTPSCQLTGGSTLVAPKLYMLLQYSCICIFILSSMAGWQLGQFIPSINDRDMKTYYFYHNLPLQLMIKAQKVIAKLARANVFCFAVGNSKRSYYDILELQPNFTQKELRKSYLAKARKYHPDHNKSEEAMEEFKLLKEAYETLKDAQKKHMYDSGVGQTSEEVAPVHNQEIKFGKKYYENKWYGYQKPKVQDTRDEYYKAKAQYFHQKPQNPLKYVLSFSIIVLALFGYDFLSSLQTSKSKRLDEAKTILDNSVAPQKQSKKQILLQRYMQRRAQQHKVDL